MDTLVDLEEAEAKVLHDVREFFQHLRGLSVETDSLDEGVRRLQAVRSTFYEDLNQIQHEYLILQGLRWLSASSVTSRSDEWYWNPRQTGDAAEPDLMAKRGHRVVLCAEATTSEKPQGIIDSRMRDTLKRLNSMNGRKFYFVRTEAMAERARTKVLKNSWQIEVVNIPM